MDTKNEIIKEQKKELRTKVKKKISKLSRRETEESDPTESWSREKNVISSLIRQKSSLRSSHVFPVTGRVNGSDMSGGIMTVILRKCRKTVKKQFCAEKV